MKHSRGILPDNETKKKTGHDGNNTFPHPIPVERRTAPYTGGSPKISLCDTMSKQFAENAVLTFSQRYQR